MPSSASEPPATCSPPLRVALVGQVDHGKSTLTGRLLLDTGSLPAGRLDELREVSRRRGLELELAFAVDALRAERDQGVTLDASHAWVRTPARDYVLVDAPGHVELLRNMVTGAASAHAALLLVDASEGAGRQSRRHALVLELLGVEQVAVVVNKMDRIGWREEAFRAVERTFGAHLASLGLQPTFVPVSARTGANVSARAPELSWFAGPTLLEALARFEARGPREGPLRFPVQDVYRRGDRRLIAGRVESGRLRKGDEVVFSPRNERGFVRSIERAGAPDLDEAVAGQSIAITLERPLVVERGQIASHRHDAPDETDRFTARVFWFATEPLVPGAELRVRITTEEAPVTVERIERVIDVDTLGPTGEASLARNGVGHVAFRTRAPVALDPWRRVAATGRFVLARRGIVGCGVVLPGLASTNVTRTVGRVSRDERTRRAGHAPRVVWLTGLPASGKTTISIALERRLFDAGRLVHRLDGDDLRHGLAADLGFGERDRAENVRRAGEVAKLLLDAGMIAIVALISPRAAERAKVRAALAPGDFVEVFVDCPLRVCEERDPKGLYAAARAGRIQGFTGVDAPYEPPPAPELALRTAELTVEECVDRILRHLALDP